MPTFEASQWTFLALNSCHIGLESPWRNLDLEPIHKPESVYKKKNNVISGLTSWPFPYVFEAWLWTFLWGQKLPHNKT